MLARAGRLVVVAFPASRTAIVNASCARLPRCHRFASAAASGAASRCSHRVAKAGENRPEAETRATPAPAPRCCAPPSARPTPFEAAAVASRRDQAGHPAAPGKLAATLSVALSLFLALTFHVNAIKSEVRLAERASCRSSARSCCWKTEFQSRASQRKLAGERVEFGYVAAARRTVSRKRDELAASARRRARCAAADPRVRAPSGRVGMPTTACRLGLAAHRPANGGRSCEAVADGTRRAAAKGAASLAERLAMTRDGEFGDLVEAGQ